MGWLHSVYVAWNGHLQILQKAGLLILGWTNQSIVIMEFNFGAFIDD